MKKLILAVIFPCFAASMCFAQFENEPDSRGLHALLQFFNTRIVITNNFIKAEGQRKDSPFFTDLPVGDLWYSVTGPRLELSIHEKSSQTNYTDLSSLSVVIDSSSKDKNLFALNNIQYKISMNGKDIGGWRSIAKQFLPKNNYVWINGYSYPTEVAYILMDTGLNINENATINFRDNAGKKLLVIHLNRVALETKPFLASLVHDSSSSHSADMFITQQVDKWQKALVHYTSFYQYWPGGMQMNNERYFPSSKLAFWFVKPAHYADSSLEYKLTGGEYEDTAWHASSHLIIVPHMQSNSDYLLQVRYKEYPANIAKYTFYVSPEWYQKRAFVFFVLYPTGFLLLFFATIYITRLRLKRANEKKARLALELKSIRAQLNPHFVFNALGSIQALINKNEVDLANQYLSDFSNLLRTSLKSHDSDLVPAAVDLKSMENYIKLEQLRFKFTYDIKTDVSLNLDSIDIPALLLQPLIENAIKHGIAPLKENGYLLLEYAKKGDTILITIKDNGSGFNVDETSDDKFGLRLTRERIQLQNKTLKGQSLEMGIVSNSGGTAVTLTFNHWL